MNKITHTTCRAAGAEASGPAAPPLSGTKRSRPDGIAPDLDGDDGPRLPPALRTGVAAAHAAASDAAADQIPDDTVSTAPARLPAQLHMLSVSAPTGVPDPVCTSALSMCLMLVGAAGV